MTTPAYFQDLKSDVWVDEDFRDFVLLHGLEDALRMVHRFHRHMSNLLRGRGVNLPNSRWRASAIGLSKQLRVRRQQLRRAYQNKHGKEAVRALTAELDALYPRVDFGALVDDEHRAIVDRLAGPKVSVRG